MLSTSGIWTLDICGILATINVTYELLSKSTKKRKGSTAEAKEKTAKKGKEKIEDRESKEASRDPELSSHAERSLCSAASTSLEVVKKVDKEEDERKNDRRAKEDEGKEKADRKEKKDKSKDKEKEEKQKEKDNKGKVKREERVREVDNNVLDQGLDCPEVKEEDVVPMSIAAKPGVEALTLADKQERRDSEREGRDNLGISDKDPSVDRKDVDGSDEDGDGKRKKERKKLARSDRKSGDVGDSSKFKDPDEGYHPANITSRFYLGQKVRAHHHGRWYDARVVTVEQPSIKEIIDIMEIPDDEGNGLSSLALTRLHDVLTSTRCFVHYLGWNSRYDESITLNKIRLSEKAS
ncbi:unnamed protein product [Angiostrongylus costaricensis]|uniref:Tudor-knot domain-containing protein n=1 Tax=Angiostrongylus costaricensis TaxID=334426 RepID=A0A0R3PHL9_ANGCS|nr:unnamed protein product [Angiostrongylus costaricensis]